MGLGVKRRLLALWPVHTHWIGRLVRPAAVPMPVRNAILSRAGQGFGPGARVRPGTLVGGRGLSLGADTYVGPDCLIEAVARVTIGDQVHLGSGVTVLTATHDVGESHRRAGTWHADPVTIGDGCWIGANATVLPGVTIGGGCVIAAGAVVTGSIPADGLYGGVPARLIRPLD